MAADWIQAWNRPFTPSKKPIQNQPKTSSAKKHPISNSLMTTPVDQTALIIKALLDSLPGVISNLLAAFTGAYLGSKGIRSILIDRYVERRVTKAQEANDQALAKARNLLSFLEQSYTEEKIIQESDLKDIEARCGDLAEVSKDGGKEVATTAFMLHQTIKNLSPNYKSESGSHSSIEVLTTGDVVNFVNRAVRLIAFYCDNSAPIPRRAKLRKKSLIRNRLKKYLSDQSFYGLEHQPFGLTIATNSEVAVRFSELPRMASSPVLSRNFYLFLQDNAPIIYQLKAAMIYAPPVLAPEQDSGLHVLGQQRLHLIKSRIMTSASNPRRKEIELVYANLNPIARFLGGTNAGQISSEFTRDAFLGQRFSLDDQCHSLQILHSEMLKVRMGMRNARRRYIANAIAISVKLMMTRIRSR